MKNTLKKLAPITLALVLVLNIMTSCALFSKPPELSTVYDTYVELIERSKKLNTLFFGTGIPTYTRDMPISSQKYIYEGLNDPNFNIAMEQSSFVSVEEMKDIAQEIYSQDYCNIIFESAFDGVLAGGVAYVRFVDDDWLCQNVAAEVFIDPENIFDYSTMEIMPHSSGEYVIVSLDAYSLDDMSKPQNMEVCFSYEGGEWRIDSPSY